MNTTARLDYAPQAATRPRTLRERLDASGLLAFTIVAYGVTWLLMIGAYFAIDAGAL